LLLKFLCPFFDAEFEFIVGLLQSRLRLLEQPVFAGD
jgi:hypothetical protein